MTMPAPGQLHWSKSAIAAKQDSAINPKNGIINSKPSYGLFIFNDSIILDKDH